MTQRSSLYMDRLRTIVTEVYKAINGMSPECVAIFVCHKGKYTWLKGQQQIEVV